MRFLGVGASGLDKKNFQAEFDCLFFGPSERISISLSFIPNIPLLFLGYCNKAVSVLTFRVQIVSWSGKQKGSIDPQSQYSGFGPAFIWFSRIWTRIGNSNPDLEAIKLAKINPLYSGPKP